LIGYYEVKIGASAILDSCYSAGRVISSPSWNAGGLIGYASVRTSATEGDTIANISGCYALGDVSAASGYAGGLIGYASSEGHGSNSNFCFYHKVLLCNGCVVKYII